MTRPGGLCLVLVEVNHAPTDTSHPLPWDVAEWFQPTFRLEWRRAYEVGAKHNLYGQVFADARYDEADRTDRAAWLQLKLVRQPA